MNAIFKGFGVLIGLFIFLGLLGSIFGSNDTSIHDSIPATTTKIAYTRDGVNFVSKERMDENIKYEYAKSGDYKEVKVPINTVVVGASIVPDDTSKSSYADKKEAKQIEKTEPPQQPTSSNQPQPYETTQSTSSSTNNVYTTTVATPVSYSVQENAIHDEANSVRASESANNYAASAPVSFSSDAEWAARGSGKMGRPSYPQQTTAFSGSSSGTGAFVGSINSNKYHYSGCRAAKNIHPENEIWFSSSTDAREHGYVPCKICRPP